MWLCLQCPIELAKPKVGETTQFINIGLAAFQSSGFHKANLFPSVHQSSGKNTTGRTRADDDNIKGFVGDAHDYLESAGKASDLP